MADSEGSGTEEELDVGEKEQTPIRPADCSQNFVNMIKFDIQL